MVHFPRRLNLAGAIALFSLSVAAVPAFADPGSGNDCYKHPDNPGCSPSVFATPELGSLLLFGAGLVSVGGYAVTRFGVRRRQDEQDGIAAS